MPPERYALIRAGRIIWGPGPRPYVLDLPDGGRFEVAAHSPHECAAVGLHAVEQRGWREIDPDIEQAASPVFSIEDGRPIESWCYVFTPGAREAMRRKIDEQAEALRGNLITAAPGQTLEYAAVLSEALAVAALAPEEPIAPGRYPFLEADIAVTDIPNAGRTVVTIREAAAVLLDAHRRWSLAGSAIRARRLAAKAAIASAANDVEAFRSYSRAWLGTF